MQVLSGQQWAPAGSVGDDFRQGLRGQILSGGVIDYSHVITGPDDFSHIPQTDVALRLDIVKLAILVPLDGPQHALRGHPARPEHNATRHECQLEDFRIVCGHCFSDDCEVGSLRIHICSGRDRGGLESVWHPAKQAADASTDDLVRARRWQRIAPAFRCNEAPNKVDDRILFDEMRVAQSQDWMTELKGMVVRQGAPGRIARGLTLPEIACDCEPPWVVCARNPNGAVSVGTIPRASVEKGRYLPPAAVTIDVGQRS